MTVTRRSFMWPLVIIAIGSVWLLMVAGAFPEAVEDILLRGWPALLILFGFDVLLGRRRVRVARWMVDTSFAGLLVTLILLGGVVVFAYQKQADIVRADQVETFSKVLPDAVEQVTVVLDLERTAVTVIPAEEFERELAFVFRGSRESDVTVAWDVVDATGALTVSESYRNAIPRLEDYGRATMEIILPLGVSVDLFDLSLASGDVTLNFASLSVPQLMLAVDEGDVQLALPQADVLAGDLRVGSGDVEVLVPAANTLNIKAQGSSPNFVFDRDRYDLLVGGELKNRGANAFDYSLDVWMSGSATLNITDVP